MMDKKTIIDESFKRTVSYFQNVVVETMGIERGAPGYLVSLIVVIFFSLSFVVSLFCAMSGDRRLFVIPVSLVMGMIGYALYARKKHGHKTKKGE